MRTGIVHLPLHGGKAPPWLFKRMVKLGGAISEAVVLEYGTKELLRRLADPYWFQAFGCVLGFDWHSSGLTTTVCGALKESLNRMEIGVQVAGGKGKASRKTQSELESEELRYASRMSAKVDSALVQDSYQLYHHSFVHSEEGDWAVIQQGMSDATGYARRYHWLSDSVESFVSEPQNAICCDGKSETLDMTSKVSEETQKVSLDLVRDIPSHLLKFGRQRTIGEYSGDTTELSMARRHTIIDMDKRNVETLRKAHELQPSSYEELVSLKGVGAKTIRSLALISELVYGAKPSWDDPVKYSFAHGGKDRIPYEIDRRHYDSSVSHIRTAVEDAKMGRKEKIRALRALNRFVKL
jgi:hypothetical protein